MIIRVHELPVRKRYPLRISRGTSAGSDNLLVEVEHDGVVGLGEMAPYSGGAVAQTPELARESLAAWAPRLEGLAPWEMQAVEAALDEVGGGVAARAALDLALYDWVGKRLGAPVYRMLGCDPARIVPTTVTIGILPPEVVRERVPEILARTGARALKVKLGSPDGLEADRAMYSAVREVAPPEIPVRVDANGGWTVDGARSMMAWLAERAVEFVEQPLAKGAEADLPAVARGRPIPIYVDESCSVARDVPQLAGVVDGVNLKLMKAGGIREGLRLIHVARAHGLKVMIGCMGETSLSIAGGVALSALADELDLDSHLNLLPDPFEGLRMVDGRLLPSEAPGLGVRRAQPGEEEANR